MRKNVPELEVKPEIDTIQRQIGQMETAYELQIRLAWHRW